MQPGIFDDDTDTDVEQGNLKDKKETKVVRWQETLQHQTLVKSKPTVKMPGSLTTPSPESSLGSSKFIHNKQSTTSTDKKSTLTRSNSGALSTPITAPKQPIARSMSVEQREMFISTLTTASDATVYVLPSVDIHGIHAAAVKLGFHARVVLSADENDPQGLLVLGRDEKAAHKLFKKVEMESKVPSGRLRVAAGGAVVGAVGAWAGLAFT